MHSRYVWSDHALQRMAERDVDKREFEAWMDKRLPGPGTLRALPDGQWFRLRGGARRAVLVWDRRGYFVVVTCWLDKSENRTPGSAKGRRARRDAAMEGRRMSKKNRD